MSLQYNSFHFKSAKHLLSSFLSYRPCTFEVDAPKIEKKLKKKYDIYQYVQGKPKSGAGGVSKGAGICNSAADERISFINAPVQSDCTADKVTNCDSNYKLSKLAKVYYVVESIFRHIFTPCSSHD